MNAAVLQLESGQQSRNIADLIPGIGSHLSDAFAQMEIAERVIGKFCRSHPDRATDISSTFVQLRWMAGGDVNDRVFEAHVEELLDRVIANEPLDTGTKAEAMMALSAGSLRAPFGPQAATLYGELFTEIMGQDELSEPYDFREPWPGASAELLEFLRRRLTQDRVL